MNKIIAFSHTMKHIYKQDIDMYVECEKLLELMQKHVHSYQKAQKNKNYKSMSEYLKCIKKVIGLFESSITQDLTIQEQISLCDTATRVCFDLFSENCKIENHNSELHFILRDWYANIKAISKNAILQRKE